MVSVVCLLAIDSRQSEVVIEFASLSLPSEPVFLSRDDNTNTAVITSPYSRKCNEGRMKDRVNAGL